MRALTKADKARGVKLRDLGCVICVTRLAMHTPPAIHHISGQVKPGCHQLTIPLCAKHHQQKDNDKPPRWISRHGDGKKVFQKAYGTEYELLQITNDLIGE